MTKLFAFTTLAALIIIAAGSVIYAGGGKKNRAVSKPANLWEKVSQSKRQALESRRADGTRLPENYLVFRLNRTMFKDSLVESPLKGERTDAKGIVMEVPMPDGSIQKFRMEETQVLSPELAAQYPEWKTFTGYGIDNPAAVGQFDWNILGFHGYISTGSDTVMVDPYQKGDTENYLVYNKSEYGASDNEFYCNVEKTMKKITGTDYKTDFLPSAPEFIFGTAVRTYRIAIATTGEWSRNAAGYTDANPLAPITIRDRALAVVMTTVNRLNSIYVRELASRFQLVNPPVNSPEPTPTPSPQPSPSPAPTQSNIIFDDPATDPYNNTDQAKDKKDEMGVVISVNQLRVNQETLDKRLGSAAYDIGHLYGTGGGGVATSPSLCDNIDKAQGYSARGTNTGDPFVVDYVAHEIGHQFGADHTYNNVDSSGTCTTRSDVEAFEVASGATIMSYVGICENRNLQQYVDTGFPSFHISSMTVINRNVTTGAPATTGCGTPSAGTNNIPTVSAGNAFTIPRLTPFTLTATGSDADAGDVGNLLYSWEEYDLAPSPSGAKGIPPGTYDVDNDGVLRPLLRPYSPISGNTRTFPSMTFILNPDTNNNDPSANVNGITGNQPKLEYTGTHPTGAPGAVCETGKTCVVGERLPTVGRTMNFRVSLRDQRGGVMDAGTTVTIAGGAGPFQVTTQNSAASSPEYSAAFYAPEATWAAGTTQTVTWDVASTNVAPVSAANVNILLSSDGGLTFPITLKANTANDGTEPITVPNNPTSTARIKVQAVDNIFFDINNANFTITAPTAATVSVSGRVVSTSGRGVSNALVTLTDEKGVVRTARTNSFGYYRIDDVEAGGTYIFNVSQKRYKSTTRVASVVEDLNEFNFTVADYSR